MINNSIKNLKPAKRYAKALMELAVGIDNVNIYQDLEFILNTVNENIELDAFLNNPVVKKSDKTAVLSEIFSNKIQNCVLNFLSLLVENNRLNILSDVVKCLQDNINESKNAIKADITSVMELDENQKNAILSKLKQKINMEILPDFKINKDILGGIIIKINDTVIDLSLKKKIENLKNLKDKYER